MTASIPENLDTVRRKIALYEGKYDRVKSTVQLIAVSKTHDCDRVREACSAGQRDFAENYLQEALPKIHALADLPLTWHFIGPIQSNKTRDIAMHFDWVHSVDRAKVARRLSEQRPAGMPPLKILLQVNISAEDSKAGVAIEDLEALADAIKDLPNLVLAGLMAIPAPSPHVQEQRDAFRQLREARDHLRGLGYTQCRELSMGMTGDYEAAIAEGATMVRIGTDIFGPRRDSQ